MRSALKLVWRLDVRHLVAHRARLALSVVGIAVGVALSVSVGTLSSSVQASLRSIAQAAATKANIEIRPNGNAGLSPDVLGRVRDVSGVRHAGATVESYVQLRAGTQHVRTLLIGIDDGILAMTPRSVDPKTLRNADVTGLWLPSGVAAQLGVHRGETIAVTTPRGWKTTVVGAVLDSRTGGRTRVVVGTVGVVQQLLGRGSSYDAIYVDASGVAAELARVQHAAGPSARAGPVGFRNMQVQQLLAGATAGLDVGSIVALFVGAFLVYNTMSMAAVERAREAAVLRAVGAKRRQIFALFCAEAGLLGVLGSTGGIAGGVALSARLLTQQGTALERIYPVQITTLDVSPLVLVAAGVAGIVASVAAALLPARRIARADPAPALGPAGVLEDPTRGPRRALTAVGAVCAVAGPTLAITTLPSGAGASPLTLAGFALTMLGVALLIPTVVPLIVGFALRRPARSSRPAVRLASGEVLRAPGRTAFTVGAVLLSLTIVVGIAVGQASFTRAFNASFRTIIAADLYVRSPTWRVFGSDVPLDDRLTTEIEKIPGVEGSWPFRLMPATLNGRSIIILAYDAAKYATYARLSARDRRVPLEQAMALRAPGTVIASPSLRTQMGYGVGSSFRLPTPTGVRTLRVGGTLNDPSAVNPEIIFDTKEFKRLWGTGGADSFGVRVADRRRVPQINREILRRLGPRFGVHVDTAAQYRRRLSSLVGSVTQLVSSVQLVAVIVAALGLANTLLISTLERRRDLGVLRAVGMLRRQLRRMIAAEALIVGGVGVAGAWAVGTLMGYGVYRILQAQLGVPLAFALPPRAYLGAAVLGLAASLVASLYPAERAARIDVVEALQYE